MKTLVLVPILLACLSLGATTQTPATLNPKAVVWTADTNYDAVTRVDLELYRESDMSLIRTEPVGKPTPAGNGDISVALTRSWFQNNVRYVFRVVSFSAAGSKRSDTASNPFVMADLPAGATNLRAQ